MLFKTAALLALAATSFALQQRAPLPSPNVTAAGQRHDHPRHSRHHGHWDAWFSHPATVATAASSAVSDDADAAANDAADPYQGTTTTTITDYVTVSITPGVNAAVATGTTTSFTTTQAGGQGAAVSPGVFHEYSPDSANQPPTTFATSVSVAGYGTSTGSSSPASSPPAGSTSGKKGLAYNDVSLTNLFSSTDAPWAYNWQATSGGTLPSGIEYCPMLWGDASSFTDAWPAAAQSAIDSGSSHLLSFNEPDDSGQANLDPATAATGHQNFMNPFGDKAQIGSPAITNGQGTSPLMGIDWLDQWFTACAGKCTVDFVAFHWYNSADQIDDLMTHVTDVIGLAQKYGVNKVWLTEMGAQGTDAQVEAFLNEALPFLDSQPEVERYAYFMVGSGPGLLCAGNSLSAIGNAYIA